jgi:hypothetical protein
MLLRFGGSFAARRVAGSFVARRAASGYHTLDRVDDYEDNPRVQLSFQSTNTIGELISYVNGLNQLYQASPLEMQR